MRSTKRTDRIITLAVLAAGLLAAGAGTPLHAQKICFVASEAIFDRLPDAKAARSKLAEMHASWMRDIQRQEQEIQRLKDDIQANRLLWSTQEQHDAQTRLADLESKLTTFRTGKYGSNGEYEKTQNDLFGPIQEKVSKAIEEEARAQKYDFVFDKSSRGLSMLYANSSYDITYQVLKRLGVDVSASEFAPPPAANASGAGGKGSENSALKNRGRREEQADPKTDPNDLLHNKDAQSVPNTTPPPPAQSPTVPPAKDGGATTP